MSTTVPAGRVHRQHRRNRGLVGEPRKRRIGYAAEAQHLTALGHSDARLAGFGLTGLHDSPRYGIALEQLAVTAQLLGHQHLLLDRVEVLALKRHEGRALEDHQRLALLYLVAARNGEAADHAGDRRADDPELRGRNDDLRRERQSLVGPARDRMHDADAEALDLRLAELDLGFGGGCAHGPDEAERKDYDGQDLPTAAPRHRVKRLRHR